MKVTSFQRPIRLEAAIRRRPAGFGCCFRRFRPKDQRQRRLSGLAPFKESAGCRPAGPAAIAVRESHYFETARKMTPRTMLNAPATRRQPPRSLSNRLPK